MKHAKMLGLALVAVAVAIAFVGSGSASASVLCRTETNPCTSKWAAGTRLEFTLRSGTSAQWRGIEGTPIKTCTNANLGGEITNAGSGTESVKIRITEDSWTSCTVKTVTLRLGELEILNISGSRNGTVNLKNAEFTTNDALFGDCSYGTGASIDMGTLTASGTGDAVIDVNARLLPVGGACCPEVVWTEEFTLTSPRETPLFVEPS
ncbi:MAG TPA: hypothetical protein VFS64_05570 [Solirubrobacterales bacterium]|nr:hypothetical protein [Solirubrobacterales bacterium]